MPEQKQHKYRQIFEHVYEAFSAAGTDPDRAFLPRWSWALIFPPRA